MYSTSTLRKVYNESQRVEQKCVAPSGASDGKACTQWRPRRVHSLGHPCHIDCVPGPIVRPDTFEETHDIRRKQ